MASLRSSAAPVQLTEASGFKTGSQKDNEVSAMLANALKRMDGLIGDNSPHPGANPLPQDPLAVSVVTQCETLKAVVLEWEEKSDTEHLQRRMATMATEAELMVQKVELLTKELTQVQVKLRQSESHSEMLSQQLHATRQILEARDAEITLLSREREFWPSSSQGSGGVPSPTLPQEPQPSRTENHDTATAQVDSSFERGGHQRRSFKKSLAKAFTRKKTPIQLTDQDHGNPRHVINLRASAFHLKDGHQLGEWVESIGLGMYRRVIEQHVPSGERLVAMTAKQRGNTDLMNLGIVNVLHCKKLRLAVQEATMATPTPLEGLGHNWVSEWLRLIGLAGYVKAFSEARIDGNMLNVISMSDLEQLEVTDPFHVLSLQRAIQAFRMCGYNPHYLKDPAAASQGSQKLLHWTAQDVKSWLWNINLDQYVAALDNMGLHGAFMLLDVRFTSESLARLLGIHGNQTLICKHLAKNFMELLGPVAAQRKLDAMQTKNFQCIVPTDKGKGKGRGKPRQGKHKDDDVNLLCPLERFPAMDPTHLARPFSSFHSPTSRENGSS